MLVEEVRRAGGDGQPWGFTRTPPFPSLKHHGKRRKRTGMNRRIKAESKKPTVWPLSCWMFAIENWGTIWHGCFVIPVWWRYQLL